MNKRLIVAAAGLVGAAFSSPGAEPHHFVHLNQEGFRFAEQLIEQGHFVMDKNGAWRDARPSASQENAFIRTHGWSDYATWHLGIDPDHRQTSKARHRFPFGDFINLHRSALMAIRSRAREYRYSQIEAAAAELQRQLEGTSKRSR
jgi:hypothetical protein